MLEIAGLLDGVVQGDGEEFYETARQWTAPGSEAPTS
jgi:hypothetical protein